MSTQSWLAGSVGVWSTDGDWSPGPAPGADDTAVIDGSGKDLITVGSSVAVGHLVLDDPNAVVDVTGTLNVLSGLTLQAGEIYVNGGALEVNSLVATGSAVVLGTIDVLGSVDISALQGLVSNKQDKIDILGTLNNSGNLLTGGDQSIVLALTAEVDGGAITGQWDWYNSLDEIDEPSGTLVLNAITAVGTATIVAHSVALDNATIDGGLIVAGSLSIENGLTFAPSTSADPTFLMLHGSFEESENYTLTGSFDAHGTIGVAGTLTIPAGTQLSNAIDQYNDILDNTSSLTLAGGTLINDGTILSQDNSEQSLAGHYNPGDFGGIHYQVSSIENAGLIVVSTDSFTSVSVFDNTSGGTIALMSDQAFLSISSTTDFTNDGLIDADDPWVGSTNSVIFSGNISGSGTILLGGSVQVILDGVVGNSQVFDFVGPAYLQVAIPSFFGSPLEGFASGDTIAALGTWTPVSYTSGDLKLLSNGSTIDLNVTGTYSLSDFTIQQSGTDTSIELSDTVSCFASGTRIEVPGGLKRPVEDLAIGDLVMTGSGVPMPIRWIGTRTIDMAQHPKPHRVLPIEISADAFGPGLPSRTIGLSPDHAVLVDGVLVPIGHLCNGTTIRPIAVRSVTYYHIELDSHDILLAEGLPVESYLDVGDRGNFANHDGAIRLFADFVPSVADVWEVRGCAPIVVAGSRLDTVRRRLVAAA